MQGSQNFSTMENIFNSYFSPTNFHANVKAFNLGWICPSKRVKKTHTHSFVVTSYPSANYSPRIGLQNIENGDYNHIAILQESEMSGAGGRNSGTPGASAWGSKELSWNTTARLLHTELQSLPPYALSMLEAWWVSPRGLDDSYLTKEFNQQATTAPASKLWWPHEWRNLNTPW